MTLPLWAEETAQRFWAESGEEQLFPRDVRRAVALTLPLGTVFLPGLQVAGVRQWLIRQGVTCDPGPDRSLRACLVARAGHGLLFVDGSDAHDEQRFSLAHELAHFLRDYWKPRERAIDKLGTSVVEILDGAREATHEERIEAVLAETAIGTFTHMMERTPDGHVANRQIGRAEHDADVLAYELLAPSSVVVDAVAGQPTQRSEFAARVLMGEFGFPRRPARSYASMLFPPSGRTSLTRRLWAVD